MFRAGLHKEAIEYCKQQNVEEVLAFGENLYSKYWQYDCSLPPKEISHFLTYSCKKDKINFDLCRVALIHLMTGSKTDSAVYQKDLFELFLEDNLDS